MPLWELLANRKSLIMHRRVAGRFTDERCNVDQMDDFFVVDEGMIPQLRQRYQFCERCFQGEDTRE